MDTMVLEDAVLQEQLVCGPCTRLAFAGTHGVVLARCALLTGSRPEVQRASTTDCRLHRSLPQDKFNACTRQVAACGYCFVPFAR